MVVSSLRALDDSAHYWWLLLVRGWLLDLLPEMVSSPHSPGKEGTSVACGAFPDPYPFQYLHPPSVPLLGSSHVLSLSYQACPFAEPQAQVLAGPPITNQVSLFPEELPPALSLCFKSLCFGVK